MFLLRLKAKSHHFVIMCVCRDVYNNSFNIIDRIPTQYLVSSVDRINICYVSLTPNDSSRNCFSLC